MDRIADILARHCRLLAAAALICTGLLAWQVADMEIDNSVEVWLKPDSPSFQRYQRFLQEFGSDELIIVAIDVEKIYSVQSLAGQAELARRLRGVDGVAEVLDLPSATAAFFPDLAAGKKMARNLLISEDERTAGMVAWLRKSHGPRGRRKVVEQIESIVAELDRDGFRLHIAGTPVMNAALDDTSQRASKTFLPLAIAVSVHSVVAFDFGMSIAPMWHSTIFAPYFVAGAIFSGIAALIIALAALRRFLKLEQYLQPKHFDNLGKMLLLMSVVWIYFSVVLL